MADLPAPRADVEDLRAFVAVARQGSVGRAAELLGRTQPTVSARLAALESTWNTRLFRREARGMAPTPEGVRLLPLAEAALRQLEQIDEAAGLPLTTSKTLRIGAGDALGREILPRALVRLLRGHPDVDVYLREGPGPQLLQDLRDGEIDLALVVLQTEPLEGIDVEPCLGTDVHLLAPRGSLPTAARSPSLRSLADRRWVSLLSGSGFRSHVEAAFVAAGLRFRPAVEVGNLSLVRRFVSAGLGLAAVPAIAFGPDETLPALERRKLAGIPAVTYHRATRADAPLPPVARELIRHL